MADFYANLKPCRHYIAANVASHSVDNQDHTSGFFPFILTSSLSGNILSFCFALQIVSQHDTM